MSSTPVYRRQKHPFMSPPAALEQKPGLYTFLQDTLRSSALDGPGIYDRRKVVPLLDALPSLDAPARGRADAAADVDGEPLPAARDTARLEPERVAVDLIR